MPQTSSDHSIHPWSLDALPASERQRVADTATSLQRAALAGHAMRPLRGKNLAVLCESPDCPGLNAITQAADALGARVSHIRPSEALSTTSTGDDAVSALLGRLYDAIDCHGVAPDALARLARQSGKPVFNALGCQGIEIDAPPLDTYTLQALLLTALA